MMETLICQVCTDDFLVRPGEEEWQKRTCTNCLDAQSPKVKRDLTADLAICEAATEGPWHTNSRTEGYVIAGDEKCTTIATVIEYNDDGTEYLRFGYHECQDNRVFIAEARQGWPEAIRRAIAAEAENERLRDVLMSVFQYARNDVARWDGGQCVGLQTFSDRMFARKLVRDIEPILFPEVSE